VVLLNAVVIVNPKARSAAQQERGACAAFAAAGVGCEVIRTERPGHAAEIAAACAARATPPDAIFTLGGDGTAMEVVGALAGSAIPVGILPGGTGNLISRTLGTPLRVTRAVRALLGGETAHIDLGVVQAATGPARHFAFAAGVGIDARMIEDTPVHLKRRLGVLAYVLTAGRALLSRERFAVRVVVDGEEIRREAVAVMIVNFGAVLGDLFRFGPGIRHDDGRLDLCLFSPRTVADSLRVLWRLTRKDFRDDPAMLFRAGREFIVETEPPRGAQADGELLGPTPLSVHVAPLAATLLVPSSRR
jgi:YegS/Rv2252/BmrU family lipid kinase